MNVVMTIAGSDSGAGAGIQADLKTILMHDLWGVSVITTITAQNTKEINKIYQLPLDIIEGQLDALISDFPIRAIKTGMLYSTEIIEVILINQSHRTKCKVGNSIYSKPNALIFTLCAMRSALCSPL